jgi:peptidoglycan/xylan/chitin deacetylase (PgdA/CDA1 family)
MSLLGSASNSRLVLCYHAVSDDWPASLSVTPELLHRQLRTLLRRGYRPQRFTDVVFEPASRRTLSVTFDDAFRSVLTHALPILRDLGIPGTVFVPTGHVGGQPMTWPGIEQWAGGPYGAELAGCTWDEIAELAAADWEIGSHTCSHRHLTALSDEELDSELSESKAACEAQLGIPCRSLAYPYGDHDERVVAAARRAGYAAACTLPARLRAGGALQCPRIFVSRVDNALRFALKTAPATLYVRRSILWDLVTESRRRRVQT